jgi:hypothetical protein
MMANYVLSGGPSDKDKLWVDDDLVVLLNGNPVFNDDNEHSDENLPPVKFSANRGDKLRIVARDVVTGCRSRSPLFLHSESDGTRQLAEAINDCTGKPAPAIFYDQTFTI